MKLVGMSWYGHTVVPMVDEPRVEVQHFRILVTGSRDHIGAELIGRMLDWFVGEHAANLPPVLLYVTVVHGGARGADEIAHQHAIARGWSTEEHPADWRQHGKAAGMIRNQEMVERGADICVGFPHADSRGTYDCLRRAEQAGIALRVVHSDGRVEFVL